MKEIQLGHGKVAVVDNQDYKWLKKFSWHLLQGIDNKTIYARTSMKCIDGRVFAFSMHQFIVDCMYGYDDESDLEPDHIDRDGLNNRRENLRLVSKNLNRHNVPHRKGTSSIRRGVSWDKHAGKWKAQICINSVMNYLGLFIDEDEAGRAYDREAVKVYGKENAILNFPDENKNLEK